MISSRNKIIGYIFALFYNFIGYGQSYYVDINNTLPTTANDCFKSNPASRINNTGFTRLEDNGGNVLTGTLLNTRPAKYIVSAGSCRWIEGPSRGRIFSLGGYSFEIPQNVNAYYGKETFTLIGPSTLYFEVNNVTPKDLDCNANTIITAPSVVPTSDIIEWEYSLNSSVGVVNNSQNKRNIQVSLNSFQIDLKQHIGNTIFFRFKMLGGIVSPFRGYKIVSCSPEFINAIPTPTTCNYDEDGSFELIIGRNINADEKLAISVFEKDTGSVPFGGQNLNVRRADLIANSNGTFSYKWPLVLPANTYEIKYQTGRTTEDLSNIFNSLVPVGEVIVENPKPVTFSLTQASDKTCFSRNDGYIDVKADGENGRTFFYQLLKDGVIQRVSGQEWIPFTNAKTTRISGLGEAKYRVKVQDSEKCFFRR